ncbi:MAG: acriflavin resistance protein [Ignavibacteriae bacterium]|nr:MAG: acriflavin resistance protein [Ignavibacteriota bacterium]
MKKIISTFIKYPFYANILLAVIVIFGFSGLMSLKKSFFPKVSSRFIYVTVAYPGASPQEMEQSITTRIEESIRGIVGIKEFSSTSSENLSSVMIEILTSYDIDDVLRDVKNAVDGISSLPVDAEKPIVYKKRETTNVANIGLSGNVDLETLKKYANEIEEDFRNSGIVTQLLIQGYPPLEISVEVSEENLMRYKLSFRDIMAAIAGNNIDVSAGTIRSDEEEILIRSRNRSVKPSSIGDIVLRANNDGSFLRIRDIANVKRKFSEESNASYMNGKTAIYFDIRKLADEDLEVISDYLNDYAEKFNKKHEGIFLNITFNFLSLLNSRLSLLYENGGLGLILVVISLALFLSFRLSLWVAWGIPSSFLGMFIVANLAGITINMISLFGMILVIGILVDDGIVIGENIFSHFEKGKSPKRAALDGTLEVAPAVLTSVTTTIVAFAPLLFLEGQLEMLYEMAFIVIFSLVFSLIEAFLILPVHLSSKHILRRDNGKRSPIREKLDKLIFLLRDKIYKKSLKIIIKWRWVVIIIPVALILITVGMIKGTIIRTTFFPSITFDFFSVDLAFTPGSGKQQTYDYLKDFEKKIWEVNEDIKTEFGDTNTYVTYTFRSVGAAFRGTERGSHAGAIMVMLRDMEGAPLSSFDIVSRVKEKIGDVPEANKFTIGGINRWGKPVSISLLGKNLKELELAKEFLEQELVHYADLKNITDNNPKGRQEVQIQLKPEAYFLGLSQKEIINQIRYGFFGGQAQRLQDGKDELRVWVRYPQKGRLNIGKLDQMKIKTLKGEFPVTELVDYKVERGPVSIKRYNASREIRIEADLSDPYVSVPPILERVRNEIIKEINVKYPGVKVIYQGQQKSSSESLQQIQKLFSVAFILIIVLLIIHFKSLLHAGIILMMIPLSFLGVAWGHGIHGHPLSILSTWGMVALSGVVINDAVVFLSKYNLNLLEGMKVQHAVFDAGLSRFRAIILTTLTTTVGLFPLILETSFQAQFLIPMAISLAYGVFVGTSFILGFFPALILVLNDIVFWFKRKRGNKEISREDIEPAIKNSKITFE